jgi:hypothetical protein
MGCHHWPVAAADTSNVVRYAAQCRYLHMYILPRIPWTWDYTSRSANTGHRTSYHLHAYSDYLPYFILSINLQNLDEKFWAISRLSYGD